MVERREKSVTDSITRYIFETTYNRMPEAAIAVAKRAIIDCIGVSLGGRATPEGKIIVDYVREVGGSPEAVVLASGFRTSAAEAALANGIMAAALDYGDTSLTWGVGHPGQSMLSAILALGEKCRISGKETIEAYIVGFEVGSRIGSGFSRHYDLGWHTTATVGTLAATAAAAKILKLNITQCRMALGIAGSTVSGLKRQFGTMSTAFNSGKAARDGVVAALLAKKGYTASDDILEGPYGLAQLMTGGEFDLEKMGRFDGKFDIIAPGGIYLKAYPCCQLAQWCIGAMFNLAKMHHITADAVAEVICYIPAFFIPTLCSQPKTGIAAQRSLEYCLAAVLLDGKVTSRQFTDAKLVRTEAQQFMERVRLVPLAGAMTVAESLQQPEKLVVKLRNGQEYCREVSFPKGDTLRDPMSDDEINIKFKECASATLTMKQINRILELGWNLNSIAKLPDLTGLLMLHKGG